MKVKLIMLLVFFITVSVHSAQDRNITWEPVAGAWGYNLEIRDSLGTVILNTTIQENFFSVSRLEPGAYSFRVATVNVLKQKGESSKWIDFTIEKLYIPELVSVSKRDLIGNHRNENVVVRGKNLKPGGRLYLRGNGREIEMTDIKIKSDSEIIFSFKPDKSLKGLYDLVVINRGEAESVLKDAIEIFEPAEAPLMFFAGAGYSVSFPLGPWSKYYTLSYTGVSLFFQISARNIGYENVVFGTEFEAVRFNNPDSIKKSTFSYTSLGIGGGYYYPVMAGLIDLFCKLQCGYAYTLLTLDESLTDKKKFSSDLYAAVSAGIRVYLSRSFFIESGCGWKTVFYTGTPFHDAVISLGCGRTF